MLYICLVLLLFILVAVTVFFIRSLKSGQLPANAKLLVDAWRTIGRD